MKNFLEVDGSVVMYNEQQYPITVLTVKHGMMYRMSNKTQMTTTITIDPGLYGLTDTWLFYQEKTMPLHCIQTRDVIPALKEVYQEFISKTDDYSAADFVSRVLVDYFVKELRYTLKPGETPEELIKNFAASYA